MAEKIRNHDKDVLKKTFQQTSPSYTHSSTTPPGGAYAELDSRPVEDSNGNQLCSTSVTDISRRKRVAEEMLEKEVEYNKAQKIAGLGSFRVDFRTGVQDWSDQLFSLLGVETGEVPSTYISLMEFVHSHDRERLNKENRETLDGNRDLDIEYRIVRKDGELRHIHTRAEIERDADGSPLWIYGFSQDITERVKSEWALKESEEKYRLLFSAESDAIGVFDAETYQFIEVNDAASDLYGYSKEEFLELTVFDISVEREKTEESIWKTVEETFNRIPVRFHKKKDGIIFPVEISSGSFMLNNRKVICGIIRDITERKKAEDALKESKERYDLAMKGTSDGVWDWDIIAGKAYNSPRVKELLGYEEHEIDIDYIDWETFIHPDDRERVTAKIQDHLKKRIPYDQDYRLRLKSGEYRWFRSRGQALWNAEGQAVRMVGSIRDITERKKSEDALKKFKFFSDHSNDAHFLLGKDARFQYVNKTACRMFGYSEDEFMTLSVPDVDHVYDTSQYSDLFDLTQQEAVPPFETINRRKDGTIFPAEITVTGYQIEGISYIFAALRDITERKKDAEKAFRANQLASIGELAAGVAHEINNPINGIINYAQILENRSEPLSREWDICNRIIKEGDRIAYIVSSLLSFARENSEEKTTANICDIVSNTLDLINTPLRKDNIQINVIMPFHAGCVTARTERIRQVFLNIISNARYALNRKYPGNHDNKILDIYCEEKNINGRSFIQIVFHDRGTGIPENMLDKVMKPFFTTKPGQDGTGLGLSISHSIVNEHGGELYIESVEGEFTKVIVELPVENIT